MKEYIVNITDTYTKSVSVMAESPEEAKEKANPNPNYEDDNGEYDTIVEFMEKLGYDGNERYCEIEEEE